jgi:hypothetical protein
MFGHNIIVNSIEFCSYLILCNCILTAHLSKKKTASPVLRIVNTTVQSIVKTAIDKLKHTSASYVIEYSMNMAYKSGRNILEK